MEQRLAARGKRRVYVVTESDRAGAMRLYESMGTPRVPAFVRGSAIDGAPAPGRVRAGYVQLADRPVGVRAS